MRHQNSLNRQRGFSFWSILILIATAGFILTIAFKLMPTYISYWDVKSVMDALVSEPGLGKMSNAEVRSTLEKRFDINRIDAIRARCRAKDAEQVACVKIERTRDKLIIDANYEKRVHVMANVDAIVKFENNVVEIPISGG